MDAVILAYEMDVTNVKEKSIWNLESRITDGHTICDRFPKEKVWDFIDDGFECKSSGILKVNDKDYPLATACGYQTIEEIAKALQVSKSTIYRWLKQPVEEQIEKNGFGLMYIYWLIKVNEVISD